MLTFKDHQLRPQNRGRPIYSSCEYSFTDTQKTFFKVYLDIKNEIIDGFYYEITGDESFVPYFSIYSTLVHKMNIFEAREVSWMDYEELIPDFSLESMPFLMLPNLLIQRALDKFTGKIFDFELNQENKNKVLICRCFEVYEEDIKAVLLKNPFSSLKEITEQTKASAGCTSCMEDVQDIMNEFLKENQSSILSNLPENILEQIDTLKISFLEKNHLEKFYSIEINDLKNLSLFVSITPENKGQELLKAFEDYLRKESGFSFSLFFFR